MMQFFRKSLSRLLMVQFALVAIIPMLIISVITYNYARSALQEKVYAQLVSLREAKAVTIIDHLRDLERKIQSDAWRFTIIKFFQDMSIKHASQARDGVLDINSESFQKDYKSIDSLLRPLGKLYGYHDMMLISAGSGHVLYSIAREKDLGTSLKSGPYRDSGLGRLWAKVVRNKKTALVDYSLYEVSGKPAAFLGTPVLDKAGALVGVLAVQINIDDIDALMQKREGLGKTGEAFLVGEDKLMRTNAYLEKESAILKKKVDTEAVRLALGDAATAQGVASLKDYRGVNNLIAYGRVGLRESLGADFDWVIIVKVAESEAYASVSTLGLRITITGIILLVASLLAGFLNARMIIQPVNRVLAALKRVADGDLTQVIDAEGENEISQMLQAVKKMTENLKATVQSVQQMVTKTNQSIMDISVAIDEQAATATEQSSSITEITATMEEMYASSSQIAVSSANVADTAGKTLERTQEGATLVNMMTNNMKDIHVDNQNSIRGIVELGRKMEEINKVMDIISNIADNTKLIAFNAALESASAGEYGKRFGVVAQEIRRLADGVMNSTGEIEHKVREIKDSVNNLVITSEKGSKNIENCLNYSVQTAEQNELIVTDVAANADAARQISLSTQQQKTASEQVVTAVKEISTGVNQVSIAMRQVSAISKELTRLSDALKTQVSYFRINE